MRSNPSFALGKIALVVAVLLLSTTPAHVSGQSSPPAVVKAGYISGAAPGDTVMLAITLDSVGSVAHLAGFDLLLHFDPSGLFPVGASPGSLPTGCSWEYFSYRSDTLGFIRLVALADINNGPVYPSCFLDTPGTLAQIQFAVTGNPNWAGYFIPLDFYWQDCGDNSFATAAGDTLLISNKVFNSEGYEITTSDSLPGNFGAPASCLSGGSGVVLRGVDYHHGGVLIAGDTTAGPSIAVDHMTGAMIGQPVHLGIQYDPGVNPSEVGGFDLLLRYDANVLTFTGAAPGSLPDTCAWEYFTYRADSAGANALVRVVGVADINDPHSPSCYAPMPGTLAELSFIVPNDTTLFGAHTDLEWYWAECGDNVLADRIGDTLFVSNDVYSADGFPITADSSLPTVHGTPGSCLSGGGGTILRKVDYFSGRVTIAGGVVVDHRGDINLNGVAYELADYSLFVDYFRFGAGVFSVDSSLQIQTTDVNADGIVLSLEDLVFLYEIIQGTESPNVFHHGGYDTVDFHQDPVAKTVSYLGVDSLAAAILTFQGAVTPSLSNATPGTAMWSEFNGTQTRVVIYPSSTDSLTMLPGFYPGTFLTYTGTGTLQSAATADYLQQTLSTRIFTSGTGGDTTLPRFAIGGQIDVSLGDTVQVPINLTNVPAGFEMAGFNFTIQYDFGALTLLDIEPGQLLQDCGWESFSWHAGAPGECGGDCPDGLVKVVALADNPGSPGHPICYADHAGTVAMLTFAVSDSDLYDCLAVSVQFQWYECADNSLATREGQLLWPAVVYDGSGSALPPPASFPSSSGLTLSCSPGIARTFNLQQGWVGINCVHPIDDRGDINLNGIAYEIADYVTFANYFLHGLSAFFQPEAQIAATDVNADGLTLTLEDLVYLYRVIGGTALPFPRPSLSPAATAMVTQEAATSSVRIQHPGSLTAAWFVFGGDISATCAFPTHTASVVVDSAGYTRVLVQSAFMFDSLAAFPSTDTSRVIINYTGSGTLLYAEVASDGLEHIPVALSLANVPTCCQLRGNVNGTDGINIADLTALVAHLFQGAFPPPPCPEEADVDASGGTSPLTVSDITFLVSYLFQGGALPPACP